SRVADALKKTAKSVVVELFGKTDVGFVAEGKSVKVEPKLETQKDGRLFAAQFLKELERICNSGGDGAFYASPVNREEQDEEIVNRKGPQSDLIRKTFDAIYQASEEAQRGFFAIITEQFGTAPYGWLDANVWGEREA